MFFQSLKNTVDAKNMVAKRYLIQQRHPWLFASSRKRETLF